MMVRFRPKSDANMILLNAVTVRSYAEMHNESLNAAVFDNL